MYFDLAGLTARWMDEIEETIQSRSCCVDWKSSRQVTGCRRRMSSAYTISFERCEILVLQILSMYKRNRRGPRIEPWGTPEITGAALDENPLTCTDWERSERYEWIQLIKNGGIGKFESRSINGWWGTESKAFFRSRKIPQTGI